MQTPMKDRDANGDNRNPRCSAQPLRAIKARSLPWMWYIGSATPQKMRPEARPALKSMQIQAESREFGLLIVLAQPDTSEATEHKPKDEKQHRRHNRDIEPVQCGDDETLAELKNLARVVYIPDSENHEPNDHERRGDTHKGIRPCKQSRFRN